MEAESQAKKSEKVEVSEEGLLEPERQTINIRDDEDEYQ